MDAGQKQRAVIARHQPEMRRPCVGRPADPFVARLLVPTRGREPDSSQDAMHGRADPVAHLPARRALPAQRMPRRHHRVPAAPVVALGHQLQPDVAEIPEPATQSRNRLQTLRRRRLRGPFRDPRLRRRQPEPCLRRQLRQQLARRGQCQPALTVPPIGNLTKDPRQAATRRARLLRRRDHAADRLGSKMAKAKILRFPSRPPRT